jgi:hypothetical protein
MAIGRRTHRSPWRLEGGSAAVNATEGTSSAAAGMASTPATSVAGGLDNTTNHCRVPTAGSNASFTRGHAGSAPGAWRGGDGHGSQFPRRQGGPGWWNAEHDQGQRETVGRGDVMLGCPREVGRNQGSPNGAPESGCGPTDGSGVWEANDWPAMAREYATGSIPFEAAAVGLGRSASWSGCLWCWLPRTAMGDPTSLLCLDPAAHRYRQSMLA